MVRMEKGRISEVSGQRSEVGGPEKTAAYAPAVLAYCRGRKLRRAKDVTTVK